MSATPSHGPLQPPLRIEVILVSAPLAMAREELLEQRLALGSQHAHPPARMVTEPALVGELRDGDDPARLRVRRAAHDEGEAREHDRATEHHASLQRDVDRAVPKPPAAYRLPLRP